MTHSSETINLNPQWVDRAKPEPDDLAMLGRVLRRDWKIVVLTTTLTTLGAFLQATLYRPMPQYVSEMMMLLYNKPTTPELTSVAGVLETRKADLESEITLMRSQSLILQAIENLPSELQDLTYEEVNRNLSIDQAGETGILTLTYKGQSPAEAKQVLTMLAKTYTDYSLARQKSEATKGIRLIERKLPETVLALRQAGTSLRQFREKNRLNDPDTLATGLISEHQSLEARYQEGVIAYEKIYSQYQNLVEQLITAGQEPQQALLYITLNKDQVYQGLMAKHAQLELEYVMNRSRFSNANPLVEEVAAQRDFIKKAMGDRASQVLGQEAMHLNLEAVSGYDPETSTVGAMAEQLLSLQREMVGQEIELKGLLAAMNKLDADFQRMPGLQQEYFELQRQFNSQGKAMDSLLTNLQDLEISEVQDMAPWEILQSPSEPKQVPDPKAPSLPRNLSLGLVGGLVIGTGLGMLRYRLDNTFHSPDQLTDQTQLPLLGIIPLRVLPTAATPEPADGLPTKMFSQALDRVTLNRDPHTKTGYYGRSTFLESFRGLHTSLQMLNPDQPVRSLVVTSAMPGDGKTTVSSELAKAAASMGKRVLLVDVDLRRPRQAEQLSLPNQRGFTTLINANTSLEELVHTQENALPGALKLQANLTVLTSGPKPPDPTRLLSSQKIQVWMDRFHSTYDLVIYDAPPLLGLADSLLIAPATDGLVLVVKMGRTPRTAFRHAMETLRPTNITVLGVVANGYSLSDLYGYYGYYGYYGKAEESEAEESQIKVS
jgi:succinoglycan biosynthesis transport protein ExoP